MRHGKKFNHLKRKKGHRTALLKSLSGALITHKRITTTLAKAKALRIYVEPLLTKSKDNTTHSRRVVFSRLMNKEVVKELFDVVAERIADRPGGYVRIIKMGARKSDSADMAIVELVDFNTDYVAGSKSEGKSGKRRRRGGGKKSTTNVVTPPVASNEEE
jgi:large subunit ribosomal protein L17